VKYFDQPKAVKVYKWRYYVVVVLLSLCFLGLIGRMFQLTIFDRAFLQKQGNARSIRVVKTPAYRGMITDRNGKPLAISTPVNSIWLNPQEFENTPENMLVLHNLLGLTVKHVNALLENNKKREFVYLKRRISPIIANQIKEAGLKGIYLQKEYRRYYPNAEVTSHLLGLTNIDDQGQEGIELAFNDALSGRPGEKIVLKDRMGHTVKEIDQARAQFPGHDLALSIDQKIQYLAFESLKEAVDQYKAKAGSALVLNVKTGEVLAMVNQPDFNPNSPTHSMGANYRNRAVTDIFEPGSVMKAFSLASAIESGEYEPETIVDTHPGWFTVGRNRVSELHGDYGEISVSDILKHSSNVGVAKIALSLPPENLHDFLGVMGFGESTGSGFPGERDGYLVNYSRWPDIAVSTLAFGYGVSVTPLQLASAYGILASGGIKYPISLTKVAEKPQGERVLPEEVAAKVLKMLESVISKDGTGRNARITGYHVAGKTGTARVAIPGGYDHHRHVGSMVGIAPASDPELVVVVVIFEPTVKGYYGGVVAGPAFSKIMSGALHILKIAPDDVGSLNIVS